MKKFFAFLLTLVGTFSLASCMYIGGRRGDDEVKESSSLEVSSDEREESSSSEEISSEESSEEESVEIEEENETASFSVEMNKTTLMNETDEIEVIVEAVLKKDLRIVVESGTNERAIAIEIECYQTVGENEYLLYNEMDFYGSVEETTEIDIKAGDIVVRSLRFSRTANSVFAGDDHEVRPAGEYKIRLRMQGDVEWTETEVIITAY